MSRALWMASGVLIWSIHFAVAYGFTGLACAREVAHLVPWVVGLATVAAAAAAALVMARAYPRRARFDDAVALGLAAFGLVAIVWEGLSLAMVAPCVSR